MDIRLLALGRPRPSVSNCFAKYYGLPIAWRWSKKFAQTDYWKPESSNMTKYLERAKPVGTSDGVKSRRKRWSPERRARQAALIRRWAPWRRSTGPITEASKARCAKNALRHGYRSRAYLRKLQRVRNALRLAARNIAVLRVFVRSSARPRIKYKVSPRRLVRHRVLRSLGEGGRKDAHADARHNCSMTSERSR